MKADYNNSVEGYKSIQYIDPNITILSWKIIFLQQFLKIVEERFGIYILVKIDIFTFCKTYRHQLIRIFD